MRDYGNDWTEEQLEALERRIHDTYQTARDELQEKVNAYFERFRERDEKNRKRLEAGEITEEYYKQWRLNQLGRGKWFEALRDEYAGRMNEANKVAAAYINDTTPGIYSLNENYEAYTIEQVAGDVGFTLVDEQTVRRLIVEEPELFYRPVIDTPFDKVWNQKKLTAALTSGILQGESIGKIADRFQSVEDMNRASALRNARTAVTSAQNAGRQATYDRAKEMGLGFLGKRWVATKDLRTRESHQLMDGQVTTLDGYFETPLGSIMQYPGDKRNAKPGDIYNCRCRTVTKEKDGIEAESRQMRVRNPITGKNELISEMTYQEWYAWKQGQDPKALALAEKKTKNRSADRKQYEEYKGRLGSYAPKTFESFQEVKYNDDEEWGALKGFYSYKGIAPESTRIDYDYYRQILATGIKGTVRVPPDKVDVDALVFNDSHGTRHGVTLEQAKDYIREAKFSVKRTRWDGVKTNYYSFSGASYVNENGKINTAFSAKDFDETIQKAMEVFGK